MSGWNRIFVVVAVVWTLFAPFLLVTENNKPANLVLSSCSEVAYQLYGSSSSRLLDMNRYRAEEAKCLEAFTRDIVTVPQIFGAMIGVGDWRLGGMAWGLVIIPLALMWIVGWGIGSVVRWIIAGFRR